MFNPSVFVPRRCAQLFFADLVVFAKGAENPIETRGELRSVRFARAEPQLFVCLLDLVHHFDQKPETEQSRVALDGVNVAKKLADGVPIHRAVSFEERAVLSHHVTCRITERAKRTDAR